MIYVHVPFCRSFCTYCDFYSEVASRCRGQEETDSQRALFAGFAESVAREIRSRRTEIPSETNTLYFGGGTPSVLPLDVFKSLLSALADAGHRGPFDEFTVEVNPEDIVEKGVSYVEGLLDLGVNRISMGVQSFDDGILKFMNRRHDASMARKAYSILEEAGVGSISIDLIFGLPQLTDSQWKQTLESALSISPAGRLPQHISSYQLSVEPGSMLARMVAKGLFTEASEELCEHQYQMLCSTLAQAGYHHYEISNFALPGHEAIHNSAYWKHVPYAGFGPGAHSYDSLSCIRKWNEPDLKKYIIAAGESDFASLQGHEILDQEQLSMEKVMLGLRTSDGLPESVLRSCCSDQAIDRALLSGDLVHLPFGQSALRIPESRFFISDSIIGNLF